MSQVDPGMKKLVQVALVVDDIEAACRRWAKLLGVDPPKINTTRPGNEKGMLFRGQPSNAQVKLAFFHLGQVAIELLQPVGEGSSWHEALQKNGPGVHHIAFNVEDKDKAVADAAQLGLSVFHQGRYDSDNGTYIYLDSEEQLGVTVELLNSDKQ